MQPFCKELDATLVRGRSFAHEQRVLDYDRVLLLCSCIYLLHITFPFPIEIATLYFGNLDFGDSRAGFPKDGFRFANCFRPDSLKQESILKGPTVVEKTN